VTQQPPPRLFVREGDDGAVLELQVMRLLRIDHVSMGWHVDA
jgi:hypothetical protein